MLHKNLIENSDFRVLNAEELQAVGGGYYHEDPIPGGLGGDSDGFGNNNFRDDLLAQWGILPWGGDGDGSGDGSIDLGGGVSAEVDPSDGSLTISALTDIGVISLDFDLGNLDIPTVTVTTSDFSITGNITGQSLSGTYNVDFGGGVTGSVSGSVSGGGFSISGGISVTF